MRALVTGATGFIGQEVCSLIEDPTCVVRKGEGHSYNNIFEIDSLNESTCWDGAFSSIDTIIHLAGLAHSNSYNETDYQSVNVFGTLRLAEAAAVAGVKRFIFVSSIGVNGTKTETIPFTHKSQENPHNAYAQSKLDAEIGLKEIMHKTGLELVIIRPTLVYGKNAPGNFGALTNLVKSFPILPFGMANNRRDFIAIQNLADLIKACAYSPNASGQTFLASDGEVVSIYDFTNAIAQGLSKRIIQLPVPVSLMRLAGKLTGKSALVEQLYGNLEVDSGNLQEVLGWTPPYTMKQAMASLSENKR